MDDLTTQVNAVMGGALSDEMSKLGTTYIEGFQNLFTGANEHVKPLVLSHLDKAAQYKLKAVSEADAAARAAYVEGVADELAAVKTVFKSEAVAISEEQAATFTAAFDSVLSALASAAKGLITSLGSALVSGAISGITGGSGGFDPSSIFPGA